MEIENNGGKTSPSSPLDFLKESRFLCDGLRGTGLLVVKPIPLTLCLLCFVPAHDFIFEIDAHHGLSYDSL